MVAAWPIKRGSHYRVAVASRANVQAGKPAQRSEQEPGGGWDGASITGAGGGGSQMVEGAKRRGATDLLDGTEAGQSPGFEQSEDRGTRYRLTS